MMAVNSGLNVAMHAATIPPPTSTVDKIAKFVVAPGISVSSCYLPMFSGVQKIHKKSVSSTNVATIGMRTTVTVLPLIVVSYLVHHLFISWGVFSTYIAAKLRIHMTAIFFLHDDRKETKCPICDGVHG